MCCKTTNINGFFLLQNSKCIEGLFTLVTVVLAYSECVAEVDFGKRRLRMREETEVVYRD